MKMPALSIRQPWPYAITHLGKDVENRQWQYLPKFRGRCLIHASKRFDESGFNFFVDLDIPEFPGSLEYERGGIVGIMEIVDVVTEHPSRWYAGSFVRDGEEIKRNYGLVIRNARQLPFLKMDGRLGFFDVDLEESHLGDVLRISDKLAELYTPAEALRWFESPRPQLGGDRPIDVIRNNEVGRVERIVARVEDEAFV